MERDEWDRQTHTHTHLRFSPSSAFCLFRFSTEEQIIKLTVKSSKYCFLIVNRWASVKNKKTFSQFAVIMNENNNCASLQIFSLNIAVMYRKFGHRKWSHLWSNYLFWWVPCLRPPGQRSNHRQWCTDGSPKGSNSESPDYKSKTVTKQHKTKKCNGVFRADSFYIYVTISLVIVGDHLECQNDAMFI